MPLTDELKSVISGDVLDDHDTLEQYSTDASLFRIKPAVVIFPRSVADIKAIVAFVVKHKRQRPDLSITARAAGTDMTGGPLNESIILGFQKYFNQPPIINPAASLAITQPGVFYRNFERETLKHNLLLPTYPASRELCAMGGLVNNNSGGEKTLRYGKTADYVSELRAVLSDGNEYALRPISEKELNKKMARKDFEGQVYKKLYAIIAKNYELIQAAKPKVSKNSAGYNLWDVWNPNTGVFDITKIFVGAQGTLGIVTEATLRLIRPEPHSQMLIVFLKNLETLGEIVKTVLNYQPTTFESYDDKTLKLALRFAPELMKRLGGVNLFTILKNSLGELWAIVSGGLPKLVLQVTFEGDNAEELRLRAETLRKKLQDFRPQYAEVIKTRAEAQEYWLIRRESFNLLRHKIHDKKTAPFVDDIVVDPRRLPEFLPSLNAILEEYDITYTVAGHIGNGNFHIIPLMDLTQADQRQIIPELSRRVYDLVIKYGGSITGEHNDGLIRTPFLKQMYGEKIYALFEAAKNIFDPKNIFNPMKKVNADLDYALQHINTT